MPSIDLKRTTSVCNSSYESTLPSISVLLPTYNRAHTLERAVSSVIAQTYGNWELIIVDDGSEDDTLELVRQWEKDSRIKVVAHEKNLGTASAINTAKSNATGDYGITLGSDDAFMPHAFEALVMNLLSCAPPVDYVAAPNWNVVENRLTETGLLGGSRYDGFQVAKGDITLLIPLKIYQSQDFIPGSIGLLEYYSRTLENRTWLYIDRPCKSVYTDGTDRLSTRADWHKNLLEIAAILDVRPDYYAERVRNWGLPNQIPDLVEAYRSINDKHHAGILVRMGRRYNLYPSRASIGLVNAKKFGIFAGGISSALVNAVKHKIVVLLRVMHLKPPAPESERDNLCR